MCKISLNKRISCSFVGENENRTSYIFYTDFRMGLGAAPDNKGCGDEFFQSTTYRRCAGKNITQ